MRIQMVNPLGEMAFLLWLVATIAALTGIAMSFLRRTRARSALVVLAVLAVSYPLALVASCLITRDRVIPLGSTQCFDDWCMQIAEFRAAEIPPTRDSGPLYYVLSINVRNEAARASFAPDHPKVVIVGRSGRSYAPSAEGQRLWELAVGPQLPLDERLGPGESISVQLVYAPDIQDRPWKALVTEGGGPPIIGEQDALWQRKTFVLIDE